MKYPIFPVQVNNQTMSDRFPEKPKSIKVKHFNDHIMIITKWFYSYTWILILFTLVWCCITYGLYFVYQEIAKDIFLFIMFILFFIISLYLLYYTFAMCINRAYIFANNESITVYHKPIPCPWYLQNTEIKAEKLERLYSKLYYTQVLMDNRNNNRENEIKEFLPCFQVYAKVDNGTRSKLVVVGKKEEALFIQKTLEDYFNIENEPQEGELGYLG